MADRTNRSMIAEALQALIPLSGVLLLLVRAWFAGPVAAPPGIAAQGGAYDLAVLSASTIHGARIATDLVAINQGNAGLVWDEKRERVLVVTWKSRSDYEKFLKDQTQTTTNEAFVTWVTALPQVRDFCRRFLREHPGASAADLELRLKQYLGLNADWSFDVFVEMWVRPSDLFRPCVDPEVADSVCQFEFGEAVPKVDGIADYKRFFQDLYFKDFRRRPGVPWTGLGYTYDWGNPASPLGASEFIVRPGGSYEIKQPAVATGQYCSPESRDAEPPT